MDTILECAGRTIDLSKFVLDSTGKIDKAKTKKNVGFSPSLLVTGIRVYKKGDMTIAEFPFFKLDGGKSLVRFPIAGPGIDHDPLHPKS